MTDTAEHWTPHPLDVQNAVAAFVARIRDGKPPAVTLMASAHEDGRLFLLIDALMWLLAKHIGLDNDPNRTKLAKLEADLLGLAALTAEYDTE